MTFGHLGISWILKQTQTSHKYANTKRSLPTEKINKNNYIIKTKVSYTILQQLRCGFVNETFVFGHIQT